MKGVAAGVGVGLVFVSLYGLHRAGVLDMISD